MLTGRRPHDRHKHHLVNLSARRWEQSGTCSLPHFVAQAYLCLGFLVKKDAVCDVVAAGFVSTARLSMLPLMFLGVCLWQRAVCAGGPHVLCCPQLPAKHAVPACVSIGGAVNDGYNGGTC